MPSEIDLTTVRSAPKVLLHDHLDGGLRPQTLIDLADATGYRGLPSQDAQTLSEWFAKSADSGSLVQYLETFAHTCAVMQDTETLITVAAECVEDLAADGVVYAEVRYAPELHTQHGLSLSAVVEAVQEGFRVGKQRVAAAGQRIHIGTLLCAMRQNARAQEIAELVIRYRDSGVVGFDIAGPEDGFSPTRQLNTFEYLRQQNAHFTIHAGEAAGLSSIWEAIQRCGAERLGHGVRIVDDITMDEDGEVKLGAVANYVRDRRITLEMCPTSNMQTGAISALADHPINLLTKSRFRVTVNTDNRLVSHCSLSSELVLLVDTFGYGWDTLQRFSINAMKSAFINFDDRVDIINNIIVPGYAKLAN